MRQYTLTRQMEVLNEILFVKSLVVCIALGKYLQSSEVGEFSTGVLSVRALGSVPSIRKKKIPILTSPKSCFLLSAVCGLLF